MGPLVGGYITSYFVWRWILWINISVALPGVILVSLFISKLPPEPAVRFDAVGFGAIGPGLAALLYGVTVAGLGLASPMWLGLMSLAGALLIAAYVRLALRVDRPLVDQCRLRLPMFHIAAVGVSLFRLHGGALPILLLLMIRSGFGRSAFQSVLMNFVSGLKFIALPILQRYGFRRILLVNALLSAAFPLTPAAFTTQTPYRASRVVA